MPVPNQKRGEVLVDLGGESRILRMDFNAIASLEQLHGGTPFHVLMDPERIGIGVLRDALFVALVSGDPRMARVKRLSREMVGDWLAEEKEHFDEITKALTEAISAAMPGSVVDPPKPATTTAAAPAQTDPAATPPPAGSTTPDSAS